MLSKKKKRGKKFFVSKQAGFVYLPDSVRYQIYLFRNASRRYFRSCFFSLRKKAANLQNTAVCIWSVEYLAEQSIIAGKYLEEAKQDLKEKTDQLCNAYFDFLQNAKNNAKATYSDILENVRMFVQQKTQKLNRETTLFPETRFPFTFKPALAIQGALVFAAFLFLAVTITTIIFPPSKLNLASLIKQQSIIVKQTTAIVAGQTTNVKWTAIIKKSDITKNQYLLALPKTAKNIKVKTITRLEARGLLTGQVPTANLAMADRKVLAYQSTPWLAALSQPAMLFNKLSIFTKYLFADLETAVTGAVETITDQTAAPATETPTAVIVDLSEQIPDEQIQETKQEEKQEEKEDKKQEKQPVSAPSDDGASAGEASEARPPENLSAGSEEVGPQANSSDTYVAVTYETQGPIITEQKTATGKIVTVSDPNDQPAQNDQGSGDQNSNLASGDQN
ncbi:MAG: hypothetical protein AAB777_01695, partial [Patescibacteria group bacterium]